jgi:hypothetical protein
MITGAMLAGKHRMMPGVRTVQYFPYDRGEFPAGRTVQGAEKRPPNIGPEDAGVLTIESERCTWVLWLQPMGGERPQPKAKIIDQTDGTEWYTFSVREELLGQRFQCLCTRRPGT